ncbi:MAG TPA: hypothetical protein V6D17_17895 [Candidatus Obscuribacterales bacterium]
MHSMDMFSDRQNRDGGQDKVAGLNLVDDASALTLVSMASSQIEKDSSGTKSKLSADGTEEKTGFSMRSEMSLTSIAMCSPLMLFGMGAMMAAFDEFSLHRDAKLGNGTKNGVNARRTGFSKFAHEKADESFNKMVKKTSVSAITDGVPQFRVEPRKAVKPILGGRPQTTGLYGRETMLESKKKDVLAIKKIVKAKNELTDQVERLRGQQNLSKVANLVSRIEILDRSLKRMGL